MRIVVTYLRNIELLFTLNRRRPGSPRCSCWLRRARRSAPTPAATNFWPRRATTTMTRMWATTSPAAAPPWLSATPSPSLSSPTRIASPKAARHPTSPPQWSVSHPAATAATTTTVPHQRSMASRPHRAAVRQPKKGRRQRRRQVQSRRQRLVVERRL